MCVCVCVCVCVCYWESSKAHVAAPPAWQKPGCSLSHVDPSCKAATTQASTPVFYFLLALTDTAWSFHVSSAHGALLSTQLVAKIASLRETVMWPSFLLSLAISANHTSKQQEWTFSLPLYILFFNSYQYCDSLMGNNFQKDQCLWLDLWIPKLWLWFLRKMTESGIRTSPRLAQEGRAHWKAGLADSRSLRKKARSIMRLVSSLPRASSSAKGSVLKVDVRDPPHWVKL
jgi:hypothetical protein